MKLFKYILFAIMVGALTSCSGNNDHLFNNDQILLTQLVYNSVVSHENDIEEIDVSVDEFSNEFIYDEMRIINSSYFTTIFDYQIEPYFTVDIIGEEIEIVVAILELHSPVWERWYSQEIMIIKYKDELTGFMTPGTTQVGYIDEETYGPYNGKFIFQSSMFLTDTAVVKYYEQKDILYNYEIDLSDTTDIIIKSSYGVAKDGLEGQTHYESIGANYSTLASDITLNLIEKAMIEKIYFDATITSIDSENGVIYCSSDEVPSIQSISLFYDARIYNSIGNLISLENLKEDDIITVYYFERSTDYNPTDIIVTEITVN